MSKGILLQLGSNVGDSTLHLQTAKTLIEEDIGEIIHQSKTYKTKAWGFIDQDDFLNEVIMIQTDLEPSKLLDACMSIEEKMGRVREKKWGPRNIDIDILFYHDLTVVTKRLIIPHPRIQERLFVLKPLCDVAPYFIHPVQNVTCLTLYNIHTSS